MTVRYTHIYCSTCLKNYTFKVLKFYVYLSTCLKNLNSKFVVSLQVHWAGPGDCCPKSAHRHHEVVVHSYSRSWTTVNVVEGADDTLLLWVKDPAKCH